MLRSYFRNTGILGLAEVILRLRGLVLMPILTNAFGAVNYGIWAQVSVIVSMLTPLVTMGTDAAAFRFLPGQGERQMQRGLSTLLVYYTVASAGVAAALWASAGPLATQLFQERASARFIVLCGAVVFVGLVTNLGRNFFRLTANGKAYAVTTIVQSISSALIAAAVVYAQGSIFQLVLVGFLADLLLGATVLGVIASRYGVAPPDAALLAKLVRFGLPLVPFSYATWTLNMADRLFIVHYGTLQDLGVYSVVYSLGYLLAGLFFGPVWLMYPAAAAELYNENRLGELSLLYRHSTRLALGLLVPAIVGVSVLGVPMVRLLSTQEFVRGAALIPLVALAFALLLLASYYDVVLGLMGRQIWSTISMAIAAGTNILLNFILIPTWGILGAACATLVGFGVHFCVTSWVGSRGIRLEFDWVFLGKACLSSLGMALVLSLLPRGVPDWSAIAYAAVGAAVFGVLMLVLRAVQASEWEAILGQAGTRRLGQSGLARAILGIGSSAR